MLVGNRGFFPEQLIAEARQEMQSRLQSLGYGVLMMDAAETPYGGVETTAHGRKFARFLEANRGRYDGVILCLPNFGDEAGALAGLQDAGAPILVHAYPDDLARMGPAERRDAFCGKFDIMTVFRQNGPRPYLPAAAHLAPRQRGLRQAGGPLRPRLPRGERHEAPHRGRHRRAHHGLQECAFRRGHAPELRHHHRDVGPLRSHSAGAGHGRLKDERVVAKRQTLEGYTCWEGAPDHTLGTLSKLGVVLDEIIAEYDLNAVALRCWLEMERWLKVSPCVLLSDLNNRGIAAACELDVCNALTMSALSLASGEPAACLDWNNNYGDDPDKCILFHCGPVPQKLMAGKGHIVDHPMFAKVLGPGLRVRLQRRPHRRNAHDLRSARRPRDGLLTFYSGEGDFTGDPIAEDFFGCAGVAQVADLQEKAHGHRAGRLPASCQRDTGPRRACLREAFTTYLGYGIEEL